MIAGFQDGFKVEVFGLTFLDFDLSVKDSESSVVEVGWDFKRVFELVSAHWESDSHVVTDVLRDFGLTDDLITDLGHIIDNTFTETILTLKV